MIYWVAGVPFGLLLAVLIPVFALAMIVKSRRSVGVVIIGLAAILTGIVLNWVAPGWGNAGPQVPIQDARIMLVTVLTTGILFHVILWRIRYLDRVRAWLDAPTAMNVQTTARFSDLQHGRSTRSTSRALMCGRLGWRAGLVWLIPTARYGYCYVLTSKTTNLVAQAISRGTNAMAEVVQRVWSPILGW